MNEEVDTRDGLNKILNYLFGVNLVLLASPYMMRY